MTRPEVVENTEVQRDQELVINRSQADAVQERAKRIAEIVQSDPQEASKAFVEAAYFLNDDDQKKLQKLEKLQNETKDTAFRVFAATVGSVLKIDEQGVTPEQKKQAIGILLQSFQFLGEEEQRDGDKTSELMAQAIVGVNKECKAQGLEDILGAISDSVAGFLSNTRESEKGEQQSNEEQEVIGAQEGNPRKDNFPEEGADLASKLDKLSRDETLQTVKNVAILAGRGAAALALALTVPGIGILLAIGLLVATNDLGKSNEEKKGKKDREEDKENSHLMSIARQRMGQGKEDLEERRSRLRESASQLQAYDREALEVEAARVQAQGASVAQTEVFAQDAAQEMLEDRALQVQTQARRPMRGIQSNQRSTEAEQAVRQVAESLRQNDDGSNESDLPTPISIRNRGQSRE